MSKKQYLIVAMLAFAVTSCTPRQIRQWVEAHQNTEEVTTTTAAPVPTNVVVQRENPKIPVGDGYVFSDNSETQMCGNGTGVDIPCRNVIDICVVNSEGQYSPMWLPDVYVCDASSPTWRTVCQTRPQEEWSYYWLDESKCATAT